MCVCARVRACVCVRVHTRVCTDIRSVFAYMLGRQKDEVGESQEGGQISNHSTMGYKERVTQHKPD